jgi:hypothetical protein
VIFDGDPIGRSACSRSWTPRLAGPPKRTRCNSIHTIDGDAEVARRARLVIEAIATLATRRELEKLQGSWSLASYETDGMRIKEEDKTRGQQSSRRGRATAATT